MQTGFTSKVFQIPVFKSNSKRVVGRWTEHFQKLLNVPGDVDHETLYNIPKDITKTSFDEIPTMGELARAIAMEEMEFL